MKILVMTLFEEGSELPFKDSQFHVDQPLNEKDMELIKQGDVNFGFQILAGINVLIDHGR